MLLGCGLASAARRDAMLRLAARGTRSLSQTTVSSSAVGAALVHVSKQRVLDDSVEIAVVKMARKPVNSLNTDLILALRDTIKQLEHDKVRGMVLASDCKVFSAGLDLNEMYNVPERQFLRFWADFESLWHTLYLTPIATVAAIESHAPAGGSILALSCDYRVLVETESVKMGLNEAAIGMVAPRWLQAMCANTVGTRNAEFLLQTGMMMTPNEALAYGFVDDTRAVDDVMPRCIEVLEALAPVPMAARHQTKVQQRERIAALAGSSSARELWAVLQSDECKHNLKLTMERLSSRKK